MVGLTGFARWELRTERPLLDLRLFRLRGFATGTVSIFIQYVVVFGYFFVASQYLAFVEGYGPFEIAAALLPVGVLLPYMSTKAPGWAARVGRGPVGGAGLALMSVGCFAFAVVDGSTSYWWFAIALAVFGAGMGLAAPPATEAIVEALPRAQQGVASATNDVARELGGAIGIALIGSTLTSGYRTSIDAGAALPADIAPIVRDSAPAGLQVAGSSGDPGTVVGIVQAAVTDGFSQAMLVAAVLLLAGAAYVTRMTPGRTAGGAVG